MFVLGEGFCLKKKTYGLKVEKTLISSPRLSSGYRRLYILTEDGIPLYEVNEWLESCSKNSYKTGSSYAYELMDYLRYLKKLKIHYREVKQKSIIEAYIKYLLYGDSSEDVAGIEGVLSFNVVKKRISILKNFYEWLEDNGEIEGNPVGYGIKPDKQGKVNVKSKFLYGQIWNFEMERSLASKLKYKKDQNHIKWYGQEEIQLIWEALPTLRDKIIFEISIESGMRIGEILGLKLRDFNSEEGALEIKKEDNLENEALAKTNERELYISSELTERIELYIRGERLDSIIEDSDYLFLNWKGQSKGHPVRQRNYIRILKRAAKKAGFDEDEIRTHSGRSTLAQQLVEALHEGKVTEVFILEQFGWSSIETLERYKRTFNRKGRKEVFKNLPIRRVKQESRD